MRTILHELKPSGMILPGLTLCLTAAVWAMLLRPARLEHQRVRSYRPVAATLVSTRQAYGVRALEYRYLVDGRRYTSGGIFPLEWIKADGDAESDGMINQYRRLPVGRFEARPTSWGSLIAQIDRFRPEGEITAYYDPVRPSRAFLIPACFFHPFTWIIPLALTLLTTVIGSSIFHSRVPGGARGRRIAQVGVAIVWLLIGAAIYWECFPPDETVSPHWRPIGGLLADYEVLGLAILGMATVGEVGRRRLIAALSGTAIGAWCGALLGAAAGMLAAGIFWLHGSQRPFVDQLAQGGFTWAGWGAVGGSVLMTVTLTAQALRDASLVRAGS